MLKSRLHEIMEPYKGGPQSSRISLLTDIFILVCIVISCALIPLGHYYPEHEAFFWQLEIVFTVIFIIEYLLRWYAAEKRWRYPFTFYALIDLAAILPAILMLTADLMMLRTLRGVRLLRLLRLLRLIRLLKFFRYGFLIYRSFVSVRIWLSYITEQYRLTDLKKLFITSMLIWIAGANALWFTEAVLLEHKGPYGSYWQSYWHILIVLVSGIEDKEPLSLPGRILVTALLIAGICIVGMLTAEIVSVLVNRINRSGRIAIKPSRTKLERHIVIIGHSRHLHNIIVQLMAVLKDRHYILIVNRRADETRTDGSELYKKVMALPGDILKPAILEQACLDKALRVIILSSGRASDKPADRDNHTLMKTLAAYCHNRNIPIVAEIRDLQSWKYTQALEDVEFMAAFDFGVRLISQAVLNPGVTQIFYELMTLTGDSNEFYTLPVPDELIGQTFKQAQLHFLNMDKADITLIGIDRSTERQPNTTFFINPAGQKNGLSPPDPVLQKRDNLVVIAYIRPSFAKPRKEDLWQGRIL
ncbi:ion transporter [Desulfococcaceae bacterium HSG9]|nr:ion transporter [Desulfococcaceae bacterium HSG9]